MLYDMSLTYGRHIVHRVTDCFICAALGAKHKDSLHAAKGYVYNADLLSLGDKATPDDETPEIPNSIHLYAKDGTTIIGEFLIGQING